MNNPTKQRFLAEWHRQEAVMLAWPHKDTDWAPWLAEICESYTELTQAISQSATPLVLCKNLHHQEEISAQLGEQLSSKVRFFQCPYDDTWCRDYGPIAIGIENEAKQLLNFQFTGWGNKYEASNDNLVNNKLKNNQSWSIELKDVAFDLEGGAIETDGQGTLLTTEACLMAGNRNDGINKAAVEASLKEFLGIERVIWFQHGYLVGDDTDSHVDNLVRFADSSTLIYASCNNSEDPHFEPLQALEKEVLSQTQSNGHPYKCIPLEIPEAIFDEHGTRLPASYVNFLILNNTVIIPIFNSEKDTLALKNIEQAFPNHQLIEVTGLTLIKQFGGPHCATMQLPQNVLKTSFLNTGASND